MWVWVDQLGRMIFDAGLAAVALLGLVTLAMLGCRQPARRVRLARAGIVSSLGLLPLVALTPLPRLDLAQVLWSPELQAHPLLGDFGRTPAPVSRRAAAWSGCRCRQALAPVLWRGGGPSGF